MNMHISHKPKYYPRFTEEKTEALTEGNSLKIIQLVEVGLSDAYSQKHSHPALLISIPFLKAYCPERKGAIG